MFRYLIVNAHVNFRLFVFVFFCVGFVFVSIGAFMRLRPFVHVYYCARELVFHSEFEIVCLCSFA